MILVSVAASIVVNTRFAFIVVALTDSILLGCPLCLSSPIISSTTNTSCPTTVATNKNSVAAASTTAFASVESKATGSFDSKAVTAFATSATSGCCSSFNFTNIHHHYRSDINHSNYLNYY
jgi:hypothetical protein